MNRRKIEERLNHEVALRKEIRRYI
jgi:hypothetical protein